ncbi:MAG TPA: hypothetical protein VFF03_18365 [Rhodocyclaceae bacterium]|nr:hypothetical protein [Rhodocyclaceae bacterium]
MFQTKLGFYALTLESAAWLGVVFVNHEDGALLAYLILHGGASALFCLFALALLPQRMAKPRLPLLALFFGAGYALPIVGFVAVLAGIHFLRRLPPEADREFFRSLQIPELDPHQRAGKGFNQAGLRSFLNNGKAPVAARLRALVALQNVSGRVSAPLLREVLSNPSEDIRLLAYGMLDRQEKRLSKAIHLEVRQLAEHPPGSPENRAAARRLSDLFWELVYQELAQGDLRTHALEESLRYARVCLGYTPDDPVLLLREGRLVQELGDPLGAQAIYERAMAMGLPKTRIVPYLAEVAYDLGDYGSVRSLMAELGGWESLPRLRPVIKYWCQQ